MKIIIDSRMREVEKEYLSGFGDLVEISPQDSVYKEISGHPDIFFCKLDECLFRAPNLDMNIGVSGNAGVGCCYPEDIKYNVCQVGNFVIHNFKYTDEKILEFIDKNGLEKVQVNQGYSNCSTSVVSDRACITSDVGIYEALKNKNIDCLLLKENNIRLIDKDGLKTNMNGFIGGASCVVDNKFILFGDIKYLANKEMLLGFIEKYGLELMWFEGLEINDYGGVVIFDK